MIFLPTNASQTAAETNSETIPLLDASMHARLAILLIIPLGTACPSAQKDSTRKPPTRLAPNTVLQALMRIMKQGTVEVFAILSYSCIVTILPGNV